MAAMYVDITTPQTVLSSIEGEQVPYHINNDDNDLASASTYQPDYPHAHDQLPTLLAGHDEGRPMNPWNNVTDLAQHQFLIELAAKNTEILGLTARNEQLEADLAKQRIAFSQQTYMLVDLANKVTRLEADKTAYLDRITDLELERDRFYQLQTDSFHDILGELIIIRHLIDADKKAVLPALHDALSLEGPLCRTRHLPLPSVSQPKEPEHIVAPTPIRGFDIKDLLRA